MWNPERPKRTALEWAHVFTGGVLQLLAIVNIFLG